MQTVPATQDSPEQDSPEVVNFTISDETVAAPALPVRRVHKRRCGECGSGASRHSVYCSNCGHPLSQFGNNQTRRTLLVILVVAAFIIAAFVMFIMAVAGGKSVDAM